MRKDREPTPTAQQPHEGKKISMRYADWNEDESAGGGLKTILKTKNGAQVLPGTKDERAMVTSWSAHCAADADLRARFSTWRELAAGLEIHQGSRSD